MPRATLVIAVEGSADVRRAFGQVVGISKSAQAAINAEERKGSAQRKATYEEEVRTAARSAVRRASVEKQVTDARTRLMKQASAAANRELLAGVSQEQSFASRRAEIYKKLAQAYIEGERQKTQATVRESERRTQVEQRASSRARDAQGRFLGGARAAGGNVLAAGRAIGSGALGAGQQLGSMALGAASSAFNQVSDQIQGARRTRAQQENALNGIFIQAGAGGMTGRSTAEGEVLQRRIFEFVEANRMQADPVISALLEAQTRSGFLNGKTMEDRAARLEDILQATLFAHQMHQDLTQTAAFSAKLSEEGITGEDNRRTLEQMTAMGFRGSVELGEALKGALRPMMSYINTERGRLLGPNATESERSEVFISSMREFFAGLQVAAGSGATVGQFGGRVTDLDRALQGNHVQNLIGRKLHNRFGHGQRYAAQREQLAQMFTRNNDGDYRLNAQYQNAFRFTESMGSLFGSRTADMFNTLGSHGGNVTAMATLKPNLEAISLLMGTDTEGVARYRRVQELKGVGLSGDHLALARAYTAQEDQSNLNDEENRRLKALLDNPEAVRASTHVGKFRAEHPIASGFIHGLGPLGEITEQIAVPNQREGRGFVRQFEQETGTARVLPEDEGNRWKMRMAGGVLPEAVSTLPIAMALNGLLNLLGKPIRATMDPVAASQQRQEDISRNNRRQPP